MCMCPKREVVYHDLITSIYQPGISKLKHHGINDKLPSLKSDKTIHVNNITHQQSDDFSLKSFWDIDLKCYANINLILTAV